MKKYWLIITNEVQRQFTYRVSIMSYFFGNFMELLAQVIIWTAIFSSVDVIKGYTYPQMMTYVVVGWFFMFLTTNYHFENIITRDIQLGTLSTFLIKPISYLRYTTFRSLGRIFVAFIVVVFQGVLYLTLFHKHLLFNVDLSGYVILFLMLVASYFLKLAFSILIGSLAFWTTETGGIYFSSNVLINFLAGAYFPANLLPQSFVDFSLKFPFVYTFYFPTQFYLGKVSRAQALQGLAIEMLWLVALYVIIKLVWQWGLKKYESVGI